MLSFLAQQAAEDAEGFIEHNGDVLDIFLLVATILFLIAAFLTWPISPRPLWATLVAIGLASTTFALMFL
jgi:hypothetical protein